MLLKGDKIKLIKEMGYFTNIGEVCEIIEIKNGGIQFKFNEYHCGFMSYNEFEEYFEKLEYNEKIIPKKKIWTDWEDCHTILKDIPQGWYLYKTNGVRVSVRTSMSGEIGKSKCLESDVFCLETGIRLCIFRASKKASYKLLEYIEKSIEEYDQKIKLLSWNNIIK